jgi:hypothetical protein
MLINEMPLKAGPTVRFSTDFLLISHRETIRRPGNLLQRNITTVMANC